MPLINRLIKAVNYWEMQKTNKKRQSKSSMKTKTQTPLGPKPEFSELLRSAWSSRTKSSSSAISSPGLSDSDARRCKSLVPRESDSMAIQNNSW